MYNNRTYFLMNVYSGVHLTYTFFFSLQKKKKKKKTYTFFIIKNINNSIHSLHTIIKECTQLYTLNVHIFSKNVHNFVHSKYTIFKKFAHYQRTYTIVFIQYTTFLKECTQLCAFNIHNFHH